jgi:hypothetical protein
VAHDVAAFVLFELFSCKNHACPAVFAVIGQRDLWKEESEKYPTRGTESFEQRRTPAVFRKLSGYFPGLCGHSKASGKFSFLRNRNTLCGNQRLRNSAWMMQLNNSLTTDQRLVIEQ